MVYTGQRQLSSWEVGALLTVSCLAACLALPLLPHPRHLHGVYWPATALDALPLEQLVLLLLSGFRPEAMPPAHWYELP